MRRIMFLVLMLNVFFLSGKSLSELPIDKWPRDKEIDDKVKQIVKRMDWWAKKTEGLDALGWNLRFVKLCDDLTEVGEKGIPEMITQIRNEDLDWETRLTIISIVPHIISETIKVPVISALGEILMDREVDARVRRYICEYGFQGVLKDTMFTPYLLRVLRDTTDPIRSTVAHAFVYIPDERAIPYLTEILKGDRPIREKWGAIFSLGKIGETTGNRGVIEPLLEVMRGDDSRLQCYAISALGGMREKTAVPYIEELIKERKKVSICIWALGKIGGEKAKKILIKLLYDTDALIRGDAAEALLDIGDKTVIPELEKVLADEKFCGNSFRNKLINKLGKIKEEK